QQLGREFGVNRGQQVCPERALNHRENDDNRYDVVVELDLLRQVVERVDQYLLRQQVGDQEEDQEPDPAFDLPDAQRVRVEDRDQDTEDRHHEAADEAVPELLAEIDPVPEVDDPVPVEVARPGQRSVAGIVGRALDGVDRDHQERRHDQQEQDQQADEYGE